MLPLIRQHLERAQAHMTAQANKKRMERTFEVGDQVYLRLQPYVQRSVMPRASQKLSFKYFGPYTILQRVGTVAYKLQLPQGARIHPVQPQEILQSRLVRCGSKLKPQVLVSWSALPDNCHTWENLFALVNAFPAAPAWGQAGSRGGGDVTATYLDRALQVKRRTEGRQKLREAHLAKAQVDQLPPATHI